MAWIKLTFTSDAALTTPKTSTAKVGTIVLVTRCDANSLYHYTQLRAMVSAAAGTIQAYAGAYGPITTGTLCGDWGGACFTGCCQVSITCATAAVQQELSVQKLTLHSYGGGWPNYGSGIWNQWSGNSPAQNSNVPANFLMINEIYVIGGV